MHAQTIPHSPLSLQVLKAERPDVDEKRSDLMKLQGEYLLRLRQLEKSLLTALNEAKGRILDSDEYVSLLLCEGCTHCCTGTVAVQLTVAVIVYICIYRRTVCHKACVLSCRESGSLFMVGSQW